MSGGSTAMPRLHAGLLIGVATLILVFQVYVSISFGLVHGPMSRDLGLSAATASTISALYMTAGFLLQLPAGIAVDRLPPGRVLALATLFCAAGSLVLAAAHSMPVALAGSLAMGSGAAFAFVGALKIVGIVVPPQRFVLWVGIWQILYSLIVAALTYATDALGAETDWRGLLVLIAAAGAVTAALLWLADRLLPRAVEGPGGGPEPVAIWRQVRATAGNRQVLLAAALFALTFGPMLAYSDLWAVPAQLAFGNPPAVAAAIAGMIPIGLGVGSLLVGLASERTGRPVPVGAAAAATGLAATAALLFLPPLPAWGAAVLTLFFGVGCAASVTAIDHARRTAIAGIGTAIGLVSAVGNLGGALLQVQIGLLVDGLDQGRKAGILVFEESLSPLLFCFALAMLLMAALRRPRTPAGDPADTPGSRPGARVDSAADRP